MSVPWGDDPIPLSVDAPPPVSVADAVREHAARQHHEKSKRVSQQEMEAFQTIFTNVKSGSLELFANLSPMGRHYFIQLAEPYLTASGDEASLEALYRVDYVRPPVDPLTFLDSTDYLGHLGADVFPAWRPYFKRINGPNNKIHEVIITGAMGIGKGVSLDTRVATPNGWTYARDVRRGDLLMGRDGRPTTVVGVFPQPRQMLYRVTFNDGTSAVVDGPHVWAVRTPSQKHRGKGFQTLTTEDLIEKGLRDGAGNRKWQIPMCDPIRYSARNLPLDPYVLGVWLADGSKGEPAYTPGDVLVPEAVAAALPPGVENRHRPDARGASKDTWSMATPAGQPNPVRDALRELGLLGLGSHERFIPESYLMASVAQRTALLQGLMDTDGELWTNGTVQYSSTSVALRDAVAELIASLGGVARKTCKAEPTYAYEGEQRVGRPSYRLNVSLPAAVCPFRVRASGYEPNTKYLPSRAIDSIEPIGDGDSVCFKVDAEDSLFLLDDYVVTHNTMFAMLCMSYKLYRVSLLKDPPSFYGMQARSKIVFGLYAMTRDQVEDVGFYILREQMIDQSPYFAEMFPRSPHGTDSIHWPQKDIHVITGSSQIHAIGQNLYALVADELNYFARGQKTAERARSLVGEVSRRLESRFLAFGGDIPGVAMFLSQTRTSRDFLEQRIRDSKQKEGVVVIRGPRWNFDTRPYGPLDNKNVGFREGVDPGFRVFVGDEVQDARILDNVSKRPDGELIIRALDPASEPKDGKVLTVPVQHYKAHFDDLHGALRAIDDVPTASFTPFFPRREVIGRAFDSELPFPFPAQTFRCHEKSELRLQDVYDYEAVTRVNLGSREPIRAPEAPRYIHLDLAETGDLAGIGMVHPSVRATQERTIYDAIDPAEVGEAEVLKHVEVDFYVGLEAGPFKEPIHFGKVRVFVDWLRRLGYWIRYITADRHQSFDMLQMFRDAGFETDFTSVDRTAEPYKTFRQTANEGRISIPFPATLNPRDARMHPTEMRELLTNPELLAAWQYQQREQRLSKILLFNELTGLEHDVERDKVDHRDLNPDGSAGSKDLADGICGAVWKCLTDELPLDEDRPNRDRPSSNLANRLDRYLEYLRRMEAQSAA